MSWYDRIVAAHREVTDAVSHYARIKSDRYLVWQEDGANDLEAGGAHEALEAALDADPAIAWSKESVQYEEDTGLIHHEWRWEVLA